MLHGLNFIDSSHSTFSCRSKVSLLSKMALSPPPFRAARWRNNILSKMAQNYSSNFLASKLEKQYSQPELSSKPIKQDKHTATLTGQDIDRGMLQKALGGQNQAT